MSNRYKGGVISATPPTLVAGAGASGTWTLEQQMQANAAGLWPVNGPFYIENVFSTYLYTGNGTSQTITNGIDLSTYGGMTWLKYRSGAASTTYHHVYDSARGKSGNTSYNYLYTNTTSPQGTGAFGPTSFNTDGFSLNSYLNESTIPYVSWTFRKQPKFFDVVTFTSDGSGGGTFNHSLGSTPGCVIIKSTSDANSWLVYHRSTGVSKYLELQSTAAQATGTNWISVNSTSVTVGSGWLGANRSMVAYLFAHDAGGFGLTGTDNVISCGSYTGNGAAGGQLINLGYEAQWVMIKNVSSAADWWMLDTMRGWTVNGDFGSDQALFANSSAAEQGQVAGQPDAQGFRPIQDNVNQSGQTYIYIAIRRGPMKVPTSGTSVFTTDTGTNGTTNGIVPVGFRPDMSMTAYRSSGGVGVINDRLRGYGNSGGAGQTPVLQTSDISGESGWSSSNAYFYNAWNTTITRGSNGANPGGAGIVTWFFQRAPRVFDEVCYTGTGSTLVLNHNLTVAPELIFIKSRSGSSYWILGGNFGATTYAYKNDWGANDSSTSSSYSGNLSFGAQPTSTTITLDTNTAVNSSGSTYAMWMWATCAGVSKVGTYTGTGALLTVDCGFTTGARFVLITRVGVVGSNNTYVYDSARGLTSSNDPYLLLETSSAEVTGTNYVDTDPTGFKVTAAAPAGLNASGGTYIFLAIA